MRWGDLDGIGAFRVLDAVDDVRAVIKGLPLRKSLLGHASPLLRGERSYMTPSRQDRRDMLSDGGATVVCHMPVDAESSRAVHGRTKVVNLQTVTQRVASIRRRGVWLYV